MDKSTERLEVRLTSADQERLAAKMKEVGVQNKSAYVRKMVLDGYCINLDLPELATVSSLLRRCSNNLNQYAKRANETGSVYAEDIKDLQKSFEEIWENQRELLKKLAAIK